MRTHAALVACWLLQWGAAWADEEVEGEPPPPTKPVAERSAAELAPEEREDVRRRAVPLDERVVALSGEGKHAEAIAVAAEALTLFGRALGPDHEDLGASLCNLASLYEATGSYEEALRLLERALAIQERADDANPLDRASLLCDVADLNGVLGRYGRARDLLARALAIRDAELGPGHPEVATTLSNLAAMLDERVGCRRRSHRHRGGRTGGEHGRAARRRPTR